MSEDRKKDTRPGDDELGGALASALGGSPGGECPPAEDIAALVEGVSKGNARQAVLEHMSECGRCREVFMTASELAGPDARRAETPAASLGWQMRRALPYAVVAGILLAVAGLPLFYGDFAQKTVHRQDGEMRTPELSATQAPPRGGRAGMETETTVPETRGRQGGLESAQSEPAEIRRDMKSPDEPRRAKGLLSKTPPPPPSAMNAPAEEKREMKPTAAPSAAPPAPAGSARPQASAAAPAQEPLEGAEFFRKAGPDAAVADKAVQEETASVEAGELMPDAAMPDTAMVDTAMVAAPPPTYRAAVTLGPEARAKLSGAAGGAVTDRKDINAIIALLKIEEGSLNPDDVSSVVVVLADMDAEEEGKPAGLGGEGSAAGRARTEARMDESAPMEKAAEADATALSKPDALVTLDAGVLTITLH